MNKVVDSTGVKYAVIAGLRTETGPERLVIAYPNQESLRDLIAAPSIIAIGFSSREEAVAGGRVPVPTGTSHQQMPKFTLGAGTEKYQQGLNWAGHRREIGSTLRRLARFLLASYSDVSTTVTSIFFPRNVASAVIRMALGSSA